MRFPDQATIMTYEVKTAVFEGPLDLLLQLITRRQVEITQLSLIDLVAEYLSFLDEMRELVDEGEFLEVFVDTPLEVCMERDPKGLYK
mgnify:CR=1 FL=1